MGLAKSCAIVLIALLLWAGTAPASGFEATGLGTKARGMGGTFRAIADDWTAAFYNPAGYANIYDNQIGGNLSLVHLRNDITPNVRWSNGTSDLYETGIFNDRQIPNSHEVLSIPSGGFVVRLPVWGETVFGLSAFQLFDQNINWTMYRPLLSYNDKVTLPNAQYRNDLDVVAFQLTAAREFVEDKLSIGIGLQLLRADLLFNDLIFRDNPFKQIDPQSPLTARPFDKITERTNNDGFGFGFGLSGGALIRLGENMTLGLTASLPFDITVDGNSELEFVMPLNATWLNTDTTATNLGSVGHLFAAGDQVVDSADFETEFHLPPSIAGGLAVKVGEKLTLAVDAKYTFWSEFDGLAFKYTGHSGLHGAANLPTGGDTTVATREFFTADLSNPVEWDDAFTFSFGSAYEFNNYLTLLAGAGLDQSAARDAQRLTPHFSDIGDKVFVTGGVIVHIQQWDIGLSSGFVSSDDETITNLDDINGDGNIDSFAGDYRADTYETVLSVNYRF